MHTKFTLLNVKQKDGAALSQPAICVWLDGDMDLKWALCKKLQEFGAAGKAAAILLEAEDPRLVTYSPSGYEGDFGPPPEDFVETILERAEETFMKPLEYADANFSVTFKIKGDRIFGEIQGIFCSDVIGGITKPEKVRSLFEEVEKQGKDLFLNLLEVRRINSWGEDRIENLMASVLSRGKKVGLLVDSKKNPALAFPIDDGMLVFDNMLEAQNWLEKA